MPTRLQLDTILFDYFGYKNLKDEQYTIINDILNNKDIWMTGEEVIKRLKSKKAEKSAQKKVLNDCHGRR